MYPNHCLTYIALDWITKGKTENNDAEPQTKQPLVFKNRIQITCKF